nr:protein transport protein sec31 like b [Quercus suber]
MEEALPEECLPNLISLRTLSLEKCPLPQGMRYLTALQELNVEDSGVVDISNDWDEMEWQGLRTLLSLKFYKLPKLIGIKFLTFPIWKSDEEEPQKPDRKNWDLIKAFGVVTVQQLTHWVIVLGELNRKWKGRISKLLLLKPCLMATTISASMAGRSKLTSSPFSTPPTSSCVIAMAWCPIDNSYLITCAKDRRTIHWDIIS